MSLSPVKKAIIVNPFLVDLLGKTHEASCLRIHLKVLERYIENLRLIVAEPDVLGDDAEARQTLAFFEQEITSRGGMLAVLTKVVSSYDAGYRDERTPALEESWVDLQTPWFGKRFEEQLKNLEECAEIIAQRDDESDTDESDRIEDEDWPDLIS